jgi:hypothetical protein
VLVVHWIVAVVLVVPVTSTVEIVVCAKADTAATNSTIHKLSFRILSPKTKATKDFSLMAALFIPAYRRSPVLCLHATSDPNLITGAHS